MFGGWPFYSHLTTLRDRFRFFHEFGGGIVGERAVSAMALARAEINGEKYRLALVLEDEDIPWEPGHEGEEAPRHWLWAAIYRAQDVNETEGRAKRGREGNALASLGGIGLDSLRDPYLRVVRAELLWEALNALNVEWQEEADKLANRATLAG